MYNTVRMQAPAQYHTDVDLEVVGKGSSRLLQNLVRLSSISSIRRMGLRVSGSCTVPIDTVRYRDVLSSPSNHTPAETSSGTPESLNWKREE